MYYTYLIQSEKDESIYIGFTGDLEKRIKRHNEGREKYTKKKIPWKLVFYAAFRTQKEATDFEKYLKSGSGKEFIRRRINLGSNLSSGVPIRRIEDEG